MTIAQKLAWKRALRDLLIIVLPVLLAVLSNPQQLQQLGFTEKAITLIGILVVPIVTGFMKLNKENGKGLDYVEGEK